MSKESLNSLNGVVGKSALLFAMLTFSAGAQNNVSYNVDAIPVPGGVQNVVVGENSMLLNTGGSHNATYGNYAMFNNVSGDANTAGGYAALYSNNTGGFNTTIGVKSMASTNTGWYNSGLGAYALGNNIGGFNNTAVGMAADVAGNFFNNATAVGNGAVVQNSDLVQLGDANVTQIECWSGVYTNTSDKRFKFNVSEDDVKGLDFINRLRPVVYNMDTKKLTEFMTKNMSDESRKRHLDKNFDKSTAIRQSGFLAQEVEAAAKESGYNFNGVQVPKDENGHYSLAYGQFVVPLVKAVQEQQKMIQNLQNELAAMKATKGADAGKVTGIDQNAITAVSSLEQNIPNPFSHETMIQYNIPESSTNAYLTVFDLSGKQVATFPITQKGAASITITSEKLSAGMYIYSVIADGKLVDSKRMIVEEK